MALPGPSRTITVEPITVPEPVEQPEREPAEPQPTEPTPERKPEKVPA